MDSTDALPFDFDDIKLEDIEPWQADHVGAELAAARNAKGITVETLASELKIRAAFIIALESGRYSDLPGLPYAIGYVRSIADHLGLDGAAVAGTFKAQQSHNYVAPTLALPEPEVRESGTPRALLAAISIVLGTLGYGGWLLYSRSAPDAPGDRAAVAVRATTRTAHVTPATTPGSALAEHTDPGVARKATEDHTGDRAATAGPPRVEAIAPTAAPAAKPPEPTARPTPLADAKVVLEARGLTWVRLEDAKGATLVAGAKHKGWRYTLPAQAGLRLTVGRANQLVVVVGNRTLPPLGPAGRAVRNLPLDLAKLRRQAAALGR